MNKFLEEKNLKRCLKKRVTITLSLLVNFFITGGVYAQNEPLIKEEEKVLEEMFYKKSDERKTQVFLWGIIIIQMVVKVEINQHLKNLL